MKMCEGNEVKKIEPADLDGKTLKLSFATDESGYSVLFGNDTDGKVYVIDETIPKKWLGRPMSFSMEAKSK